jgi:DNA-binding transcriptional LysR family regulator|tara:strand:- start:759 stop:1685 length:927 start_codon:yes stop_codon:yes gene_type:complete
MDLRHLRYFVAVAEEGNVTRAAERLGIQQPPLSQQIQALERELDTQLLRRKPRGVEMTEAGRALLADAREILERVERTVQRVKRRGRGEEGSLAIGFTSSASFHPFVLDAIRAFGEGHGRVSLELEESNTGELVAAIHAEQMDVAFIRSPVSLVRGLTVHRLLDEDMAVAVPADHPLARDAGALPLTALEDEAMILYRRRSGPGLYDTIIAACHAAGFSPRVEQEAPRIVSTLNLVAAGVGISLVPASLDKLHLEGVRFRPLAPGSGLSAPLNLTCPSSGLSIVAARFVDHVRQAARRLNQDISRPSG